MQYIVKSNGQKEEFDPSKLNKWAEYAADHGVEWSSIALEAYRKCYDGCSTSELHKAMIDACVEREDLKHLRIAGRLLVGSIYKEAFGGYSKIPSLADFMGSMWKQGYWDWLSYSKWDLEELEKVIDHSKDNGYIYTSLRQMRDKYLIQNRKEQRCLETPQFMFMGMAMRAMEKQPAERRLKDVKALYTYLSDLKINAPTPFLVNMRTPHKGYASCCVSIADDTLNGLATNDHIAYVMTAKSAGIGCNVNTRSKGDPIRGGTVVHQGKLPYLRALESNVHANMQSSRGGACTVSFSCMDLEIEDLLVLKNPTTIQQKRIRNIDYSMLVNMPFIQRVAKNEDWMLVSIQAAPELYEYFYSSDVDGFESEYQRVLADENIPKKIVKARQVANIALRESAETGRIYITYIDRMNTQTPFKDTIYSSNLCQEIALPTKPFADMPDLYSQNPKGEIGLCSLASIVVGRVDDDEYADVAYYTLLMIDNSIDQMEYPFPSLKYTAQARRSVGIGITNLAHAMAAEKLKYSSPAGREFMNYVAERHSYWLFEASLQLAIEKGNCQWMNVDRSKYVDGWFPHDDRCLETNTLLQAGDKFNFNWENLRRRIKKNGGIRNSALIAYMPNESSSQLTNTTNSLYPIRNYKVMKTSGNNKNLLIAPEFDVLGPNYELAWGMNSTDIINIYAIFQRFTDQAISSDLYLNLQGTAMISTTQLLKDLIYMAKMGCKTRYYINSAAGIIHDTFITEEPESDCPACKL